MWQHVVGGPDNRDARSADAVQTRGKGTCPYGCLCGVGRRPHHAIDPVEVQHRAHPGWDKLWEPVDVRCVPERHGGQAVVPRAPVEQVLERVVGACLVVREQHGCSVPLRPQLGCRSLDCGGGECTGAATAPNGTASPSGSDQRGRRGAASSAAGCSLGFGASTIRIALVQRGPSPVNMPALLGKRSPGHQGRFAPGDQ